MKIAVYTALFANKDALLAPIDYQAQDGVTYMVFTDDDSLNVPPYRTYIKTAIYNDMAKNARYYKIMGDVLLYDFDLVIWHDANIQIRHAQLQQLIAHSKDHYLTTFYHPHRNDFYSEAMTSIRTSKDFSLRILWQAFVYFCHGMPAHKGMYSTGVLIKNSKHQDYGLMHYWWQQTLKHSRRDQLSLAYSLFKTNTSIGMIQEDIFNNPYTVYRLHNYQHYKYKETSKVMAYNYQLLKKLSYFCVQLMRKIKKL